jgi:hypothetical protein
MVALRDPVSVGIATRVLAIPLKRANTRVRQYLTREEMEAILGNFHFPFSGEQRHCAHLAQVYPHFLIKVFFDGRETKLGREFEAGGPSFTSA